MRENLSVSTGEVKVCTRSGVLKSRAIGSCVVIVAYDSKKKLGVMAHIMLPGRAPKSGDINSTRYAADAIDHMIYFINVKGANICDLEVCLVGAGNVLKRENDAICKDNIESVKKLLKEKKIPVRAEVLGGNERKSVSLDVETGVISYTEGDGKEKKL